MLKLDLRMITELIAHSQLSPPCGKALDRSAMIGRVTAPLLEAFVRLICLIDYDVSSQTVIAPLIIREIHDPILLSNVPERL